MPCKTITIKEIISNVDNFRLWREDDFYYVVFPDGSTMVDMSGSKEEVIAELERWKKEIDSNNPFMLEIENGFIAALKAV